MLKSILKSGFQAVTIMLLLCISGHCSGTGKSKEAVISAFLAIDSSPSLINYLNDKEINNSGGHLQGIQWIERTSGRYVVMTGSSDTYAYYSVVKMGDKNRVFSVNRLMDKPFKHAGGFQVFQNYLAVGIEDNSEKDKSMVCIYDISDPEKPGTQPLSVIKRAGEPLRSTAGCVGITKYRDKVLLAAGDWDTRHIDLYTSPFTLSDDSFVKIFTLEMDKVSRANWTDPNWWSYQNINLFTFNGQEVYLVGLGQNSNNEDIADLFSLEEVNPGNFTLVKIATKKFSCRNEASFKAAAGVMINAEGQFSIISSGYNIHESSFLNLFKSPGK
jgi:hypothetical protein